MKRGESECFRIDSGVRQVCIMFSWLFNVYMDAVMKEVKMGMGRRGESGDCLAFFIIIPVDGICLEHVSEFKYLGCFFDESGTDGAECNRKVGGGLQVPSGP